MAIYYINRSLFLAIILARNPFNWACQSTQMRPPMFPPPLPGQPRSAAAAVVAHPQLVSNLEQQRPPSRERETQFAPVKEQNEDPDKQKDEPALINGMFNETAAEIRAELHSTTTTTLGPNPCNTANVLAVTTQPYSDQTVQADHAAMMGKLNLLETFLRIKLASFGDHAIQPSNEGGFYAIRIMYTNVTGDCEQMRDFAAKTVSYSKEVERALFNCKCGDTWVISKIH